MSEKRNLYVCAGGTLVLPASGSVLADRAEGGNLVVAPPRPVWDRSALTREEHIAWSFLAAAAGEAMMQALPQLEGGCINYWDAGNWALNDAAPPQGPKTAHAYRKLHLHLLGRSPASRNPDYAWGESPVFPAYAERATWSKGKALLTSSECCAIVARTEQLLADKYDIAQRLPWSVCAACNYPMPEGGHGCTT
jgi:hypothetical protein